MQLNEDGQRASAMGGNAMSGNAELALQVQMLKTRLDVVLPTLATREQLQQEMGSLRGEIGGLRTEMHQAFNSFLKWGLGIALTSIVAAAAVVTAMAPMFQLSARGRDVLAMTAGPDEAPVAQRE